MSYKVFIFIVFVVAALYYFLSSFFAPIGSTVTATGMVMGQTVDAEADGGARNVWIFTITKGITKVAYADNTGCYTDLGPQLKAGDVVEFSGIFQDTLLVSLCKAPDGYLKKDNNLSQTKHVNNDKQN